MKKKYNNNDRPFPTLLLLLPYCFVFSLSLLVQHSYAYGRPFVPPHIPALHRHSPPPPPAAAFTLLPPLLFQASPPPPSTLASSSCSIDIWTIISGIGAGVTIITTILTTLYCCAKRLYSSSFFWQNYYERHTNPESSRLRHQEMAVCDDPTGPDPVAESSHPKTVDPPEQPPHSALAISSQLPCSPHAAANPIRSEV